jgi:hypothetical protein
MDNKKQHVIPECYQKTWVDPNTPQDRKPYIWLYNKKGDIIKKKSPKNLFTESNFYTITTGKKGRDLTLEKGLSTLESLYKKVYNEVLSLNRKIKEEDKLILCAFVAAMNCRTWAHKKFVGDQFKKVLEISKQAEKHLSNKRRNPKRYAITLPSAKNSNKLSFDDINELAERPLQSLMFPKIATDINYLFTMNIAILFNDAEDCFCSSDDPCTLFDSTKHEHYYFLGSPPLARNTIEVTLPISPRQVIYMTRSKLKGYVKADKKVVSMMNRRTISTADKFIIYNSDNINKEWFQTG